MVRRVAAAVEAFASTGLGDIKPLQGKLAGKLRLRVSDQRVFLDCDADAIRVLRVVARSEAYR
jgi:mRNA-degrading endonuclease RelE of RelBE toxin-antitoxin system